MYLDTNLFTFIPHLMIEGIFFLGDFFLVYSETEVFIFTSLLERSKMKDF